MSVDFRDFVSRLVASMTKEELEMLDEAREFWRQRVEEVPTFQSFPRLLGYIDPLNGTVCVQDASRRLGSTHLGWAMVTTDDPSIEDRVCWLCGEYLLDQAEDGE